jgi:hypothetical protein
MKYILVLLTMAVANAQENRLTTPAGHFLEYDIVPVGDTSSGWAYEHYTLSWGDTNFFRAYPETVVTRYGLPYELEGENTVAIIVNVSPRNYEWYALVLPISDTKKVLRFEQPHAYDLTRNLIAYCDDDN